MVRELRRRVLETNKTISRRAQQKIDSGAASPAGSSTASRTASRMGSRAPSDDEDDASEHLSTTGSIDELAHDPFLEDDGSDAWKQYLAERMEEIVNTKRSTIEGREKVYATHAHILKTRYCAMEVDPKVRELIPTFLKSVKNESSEREAALAIKAIQITLITCPSETAYESIHKVIKQTYTSSESNYVKAAAIRSLGSIALYGGAGDDEMLSIMDELLEIISSDGASIEATDEAAIVEAALQEWGFLATQIEDLEEQTEDAMEAFVEQLDSGDTGVQVAAGECIALLFEKSYTEREEDDEAAKPEDVDEEGFAVDNSLVKRYDVHRQIHQLKKKLEDLASISSKGISRDDRKRLHTSFGDVLNTVSHPQRGPRYSNAIDQETGQRYGSRMTIRINDTGIMRIDRWWKLLILNELRRVLGGGFLVHYEENEVVFGTLPIMIDTDPHGARK